jgi:hypothetical protein
MIRRSLKSLTLIALVFGISSQAAKADVDLSLLGRSSLDIGIVSFL